jgi:hypothetical protein
MVCLNAHGLIKFSILILVTNLLVMPTRLPIYLIPKYVLPNYLPTYLPSTYLLLSIKITYLSIYLFIY